MTAPSNNNNRKAIFYMTLLAVQFGIQPILTRRFTPQEITKSTVVLMQEVIKMGIAYMMLRLSGGEETAFQSEWCL